MPPEVHEDGLSVDHGVDGADHALRKEIDCTYLLAAILLERRKRTNIDNFAHLPNPAQISEIEDVVEFGWGREHLALRHCPDMQKKGV